MEFAIVPPVTEPPLVSPQPARSSWRPFRQSADNVFPHAFGAALASSVTVNTACRLTLSGWARRTWQFAGWRRTAPFFGPSGMQERTPSLLHVAGEVRKGGLRPPNRAPHGGARTMQLRKRQSRAPSRRWFLSAHPSGDIYESTRSSRRRVEVEELELRRRRCRRRGSRPPSDPERELRVDAASTSTSTVTSETPALKVGVSEGWGCGQEIRATTASALTQLCRSPLCGCVDIHNLESFGYR